MAYGSSGTNLAYYNPRKLEPYLYPSDARTEAAQFAPNLTLSRGTVVGSKAADSKWYAYENSAVPVAMGILVYDIVTDASGNVILGNTGAVADLVHAFSQTAEVYVAGTFLESELTGLDAAAIADFQGREIGQGTSKYLVIPG